MRKGLEALLARDLNGRVTNLARIAKIWTDGKRYKWISKNGNI
jgi:hypothetical protein